MECEASLSTDPVEDSEMSAAMATCDLSVTGISQPEAPTNSSESINSDTGSDHEQKPQLTVAEGDDDRPAVNTPKLEPVGSHSSDDNTWYVKEPKLEVDTSCDNGEHLENPAKRLKLETENVHSTVDTGERNDRRRNKSTSAAVLLGLVKSRVHKLATQRRETALRAASSDTALSVSSPTAVTVIGSLSATSLPKTSTPPGECSTTNCDNLSVYSLGSASHLVCSTVMHFFSVHYMFHVTHSTVLIKLLPSASQHPSYGDCLELKREY